MGVQYVLCLQVLINVCMNLQGYVHSALHLYMDLAVYKCKTLCALKPKCMIWAMFDLMERITFIINSDI